MMNKIEIAIRVLANTRIVFEKEEKFEGTDTGVGYMKKLCDSNFEPDEINKSLSLIVGVFEGVRLAGENKLTVEILKDKYGINPEEANMI